MFDGDANPANVNSASDWTREPTAPNSDDNGSSLATNRRRSAFDAAPLTDATPEQAPRAERHFVKLREHRQPLEAAPQTPADALPPAHSTRRHVIGFSEPILWQSVEDRSPLVPTLSLVSSSRDGGARLASATSPSADLRDIARKGERPRASTQPDNSFLIPASGAESPNFGSIELSSDVARGSVARDSGAVGSVLFASSQSGLQTSLTDGPVLGGTTDSSSSYSSSPIPAGADQPRRSTGKKLAVAKSSHGVSRQSFALIEPLALSLKLPVATTASLLGGTGLALLGLGLLLVRAAFRWRHAG